MGALKKSAPDVQGFASPTRANLALRIEAYNTALRDLPVAEAAAETAMRVQWAAEEAVTEAKAGVERAKEAAAAHMAGAGDSVPPTSIRAARDAVQDALDNVDVAKSAREAIKQRVTEIAERLPTLKRFRDDAAIAVIREAARPAIDLLMAELERLQRQVVDKGVALHWLLIQGCADKEPVRAGNTVEFARAVRLDHRFQSAPAVWYDVMKEPDFTGSAPWRAALAALEQDATAPLPGAK